MYEYVGGDNWMRTTVFELARWKNGLAFKNINFAESGRPIIKIAELKSGITKQTKFTDDVYDKSVFVKSGDMLFSWSGNPDTSIDVFRWDGPEGWLNQHIYKVTPKGDVDEDFLFFLLRWLRPRFASIARNKQTTGLGHVTLKDFKSMAVGLPTEKEQRSIVSFIAPFQRKIELNQRMNETLEAIAKAIFKDWFVNFGPVRRKIEGETDPVAVLGGLLPNPEKAAFIADLFPDTFGDNGLPEGWTDGTLGDYAFNAGTMVSPSDVSDDTPYIGLEHMPRNSIALSEWETSAKVTSNKSKFVEGQILYGKLRPYFHKVGVAAVSGICSTDIVVIDGKTAEHSPFVAACVSSSEFVDYTDKTSTGTKMPRTSWSIMKQYPVPLVPHPTISEFGELVAPLFARLNSSIQEIRTLAQTRDLLLPKLMSGEIRVADTKVTTELTDA